MQGKLVKRCNPRQHAPINRPDAGRTVAEHAERKAHRLGSPGAGMVERAIAAQFVWDHTEDRTPYGDALLPHAVEGMSIVQAAVRWEAPKGRRNRVKQNNARQAADDLLTLSESGMLDGNHADPTK